MARLPVLHLEQQRRPAVPVPELGRIDAVPARHLSGLKQKENGGGMSAAMRPGLVAERLAEPAAFGMGLELELGNHFLGGQRFSHAGTLPSLVMPAKAGIQ